MSDIPLKNYQVKIYNEVLKERRRQDEKFGGPDLDDKRKRPFDWVDDILAYAVWAKQMYRMASPSKYRRRLIQVAALAVAAVEQHDRRYGNETESE
jgi:hypothetical protein